MAIGGTIQSVTIDGREFQTVADASSKRVLGGFKVEKKSNGNGTTRTIKTRIPWELEVEIVIDDDNGDQEFLQAVIDNGIDVDVMAKYAGDAVYQGTGMISDAPELDSSDAKTTIKLSGGGKLQKI